MIQSGLAYVALLLIASAVFWTMIRPSVAIGLLISLYAAEQILTGRLPFMSTFGQGYNFFIGGVCLLAMGSALMRFGFPRLPRDYLSVFAALFFFVCASLVWTSSPILGAHWVKHFAAEVPLAILLPIITLRRSDDFRPPVQISILLALIITLGIIASPFIGLYSGRTHLAEGATVLSPAEFTGIGFVFVATLDRKFLGVLAKSRIPIAIVLALGTLLSGARGQFLLAIGIAGAIQLGRLYRTQLTGILATIAMVLIGVMIAFAVILTDINIPSFRSSERFTTESIAQGLDVRLGLIKESLTLEKPIFGHGVAGWSYMHNHVDAEREQIRHLTRYPHNSLAQVYFEFGIVGLMLFCSLLYIGARNARFLLVRYKNEPTLRSLTATVTGYFFFSFLLSLKQSTFLAAIGLYLSGSMLCALMELYRSETLKNDARQNLTLSGTRTASDDAL